jgi:integrase
VKEMAREDMNSRGEAGHEWVKSPDVKCSRKYEAFGETIRYLTLDEWHRFLDCIEDYRHKLMMQVIYELGCRVGEFVRIQLKHLDFGRSSVYFPAENTKTRYRRTSYLHRGVMNEVKSLLKAERRMTKRSERPTRPEEFLFRPPGRRSDRYSENRIRQVFQRYVRKAGLDREYGQDTKGRKLHQFTVHSLRHNAEQRIMPSPSARGVLYRRIAAHRAWSTRHNQRLLRNAKS